jgi:copper chaperone CopZ
MSCSGCVSKAEKFLNSEKDILKWNVDLNSPDKILTIESEKLDPKEIPILLLKAGYKAVQI